jgi:hypothetical protein
MSSLRRSTSLYDLGKWQVFIVRTLRSLDRIWGLLMLNLVVAYKQKSLAFTELITLQHGHSTTYPLPILEISHLRNLKK